MTRNKKNKNKEKSYLIKMPVFTTISTDKEYGFFDNINYNDMIDLLKKKINDFKNPIEQNGKNKAIKTVVDKVDYEDVSIGDVPALLLNISSYKTNLYNGYFENTEKIKFRKDNRIGSDSNYVLFYPRIIGYTPQNYTCFFLMLVYEDPTKESGEVSHLAKIVTSKILEQPIQNIKLPNILEELKRIGNIPELKIKYFGIERDDESTDVKYLEYVQSCKVKNEKESKFKDMPYNLMEDLISDTSEDSLYCKKETFILLGKTEYRIKKKLIDEASEELKETAEKIFNATTAITQFELDNMIYTKDFMLEKMSNVITNYISAN